MPKPYFFRKSQILADLPQPSLQWLEQVSHAIELAPGEVLPTEEKNGFYIIIDGVLGKYRYHDNIRTLWWYLHADNIIGHLPFGIDLCGSAEFIASVRCELLQVSSEHFDEMIGHHDILGTLFNWAFKTGDHALKAGIQNEKLIALGKISQVMSTEFNIPTSKLNRNSKELAVLIPLLNKAHVELVQSEPRNLDKIFNKAAELASAGIASLSMMQKNEREEEIADWLEANGEQNGFNYAECFASFGMTPDDLNLFRTYAGDPALEKSLAWLHQSLNMARASSELSIASSKLSQLVGSINRYNYTDLDTEKKQIILNHGLQSTLELMNYKAKRNGIRVVEEYDPNLPAIHGVPSDLSQVWTNLIDNALDAMENDGGTLIVKTTHYNGSVEASISDTGAGIPIENLKDIFNPFYTTKPPGVGTGLGLDIVRRVLHDHQAEVVVKSEPGNTCFQLIFNVHPQS